MKWSFVMTSDAKIGLLLGLAFIFIIAFIINGLPSFRHKTNSNELTTNNNAFDDTSIGIGTKERKTQEDLNLTETMERNPLNKVQALWGDETDIRSVTPLPGNSTPAQIAGDIPSSSGARETIVESPKPAKQDWPKYYNVCENDNLAFIAKKFYGAEEGNRRINIDKIFEANRRILKSPDEISIGQKLIIPLPSNLTSDKSKVDEAFSSTLFEKVKSIGRSVSANLPNGRELMQGKSYVVRQGDSLWKIASEQLGNGARYAEIAKLNVDIVSDEDNIPAGLRLKLPAQ
jgi:nucleoid-associated protein YgaU